MCIMDNKNNIQVVTWKILCLLHYSYCTVKEKKEEKDLMIQLLLFLCLNLIKVIKNNLFYNLDTFFEKIL